MFNFCSVRVNHSSSALFEQGYYKLRPVRPIKSDFPVGSQFVEIERRAVSDRGDSEQIIARDTEDFS